MSTSPASRAGSCGRAGTARLGEGGRLARPPSLRRRPPRGAAPRRTEARDAKATAEARTSVGVDIESLTVGYPAPAHRPLGRCRGRPRVMRLACDRVHLAEDEPELETISAHEARPDVAPEGPGFCQSPNIQNKKGTSAEQVDRRRARQLVRSGTEREPHRHDRRPGTPRGAARARGGPGRAHRGPFPEACGRRGCRTASGTRP